MHIIIIENDSRAAENIGGHLLRLLPRLSIRHCRGVEPDLVQQSFQADIILLDMHLGIATGVDLCRSIRKANGITPILGITCNPLEFYRSDLCRAGAQGLVQKEYLKDVVEAIQNIISGNPMQGFGTPQQTHNALLLATNSSTESSLTPQELDILRIIGDVGADPHYIAQHKHIKESTARTHLKSIRRKLGCNSNVELTLYVARHPEILWGS